MNEISRAGTSNYSSHYMWDAITCPCPWYKLCGMPLQACSHLSVWSDCTGESYVYKGWVEFPLTNDHDNTCLMWLWITTWLWCWGEVLIHVCVCCVCCVCVCVCMHVCMCVLQMSLASDGGFRCGKIACANLVMNLQIKVKNVSLKPSNTNYS